MPVTKVTFTPAAATKIATAVKQVLGEAIDLRGRPGVVRTAPFTRTGSKYMVLQLSADNGPIVADWPRIGP